MKEVSQSAAKNSPFTIRHSQLHSAPKIFTETCKIDWNKTVEEVYNLIRGLSPYPAAFTVFDEKNFKIYRAEKESTSVIHAREYETDKKTYLKFRCANGFISAKEIQVEGKKKMLIEDFLRGYR